MKSGGFGEILHTNTVRFRVTGSGSLNLFLRSLDDIRNQELTPIVMQSVTNREPNVLANFKEQQMQLELFTTEIDEFFTISKIVIFTKPVETGYPQ